MYLFVTMVSMLVLFVFATTQRVDASFIDAFETAFFLRENIFEAILSAIVQRLSIFDNLYQISNQLYNQRIYDHIGFFQFFASTFDLIMPGTYFRGNYSLSALNMVWLYNYELSDLNTEWASIGNPLYATNYLYFGFLGGWLATIIAVMIYCTMAVFSFTKIFTQRWIIFFGAYLCFNFAILFLTSFGYEYMLRQVIFGFFNIALYGFIATHRFRWGASAHKSRMWIS